MKWAQDLLEKIKIMPLQKFLIVEGTDDQILYQRWLEKLDPGANAKVQVETPGDNESLGNKNKVLRALEWLRGVGGDPANVVGLVDRDAWTDLDIQAAKARLPRLRVNARRHTVENYFTDPNEIAASLFAKDKAKYKAGWEKLRTKARASLDDRVAHWALWCTLQRGWTRLNIDSGFPTKVLDQLPLPTERQIEGQLRTWAKALSVPDLMREFRKERDAGLGHAHSRQFQSCVHGKDFFPQVVKGELCRCEPAIKAETWMTQLIEWSPVVPNDLKVLLQDLVA